MWVTSIVGGLLTLNLSDSRRLPQRERNLLIVAGFLRELLELHERLIATVERELDASVHPALRTAPAEA